MLHVEGDVAEGPDVFRIAFLGTVVGLADLQVGVFLVKDFGGPPAVEVMGEGAGADLPQAIKLSYVVELYGYVAHFYTVSMKLRSVRLKMMTARKRVTARKMKL